MRKGQPAGLRSQIDGYFQSPDGPGQPNEPGSGSTPKAIVAPHIDFHRGGPCYAWGHKELVEAEGADLYTVLGTSHCGGQNPFSAILKDSITPFRTVEADKEFVRELQKDYRGDLFAEQHLHRTEHSIEFQVVFLECVSRRRAEILTKEKPSR